MAANPLPRSFALAETRRRYEVTPRTLDDELLRMARGDRGCLGDAVSGFGAVGVLLTAVLAYMGFLGAGFMVVFAGLMIGGFVLSSAAQARSGPARYKALTEGPLALGRVLRADPALFEPGDVPYPALVVFAVDAPHRFDADYLHGVAAALQALRDGGDAPAEQAEVAAMLRDPNRIAPLRLPPALAGAGDAWLGVISVDPRRLPARRIEDHLVPVIAAPGLAFVEHV
ncbi:hypothetical protein [Nannocystis bainbridge]|uniref:Uncharacterized protein n=1 Tax=Nannocystis bainbridge TaxID=2995303 RepID=A0ABT5E7R0_9BACT|nr:hypothetical protein [Nannocystis bainbridge]MDC0720811.1 hypothetical protein [Nannocystis bainbridge]